MSEKQSKKLLRERIVCRVKDRLQEASKKRKRYKNIKISKIVLKGSTKKKHELRTKREKRERKKVEKVCTRVCLGERNRMCVCVCV